LKPASSLDLGLKELLKVCGASMAWNDRWYRPHDLDRSYRVSDLDRWLVAIDDRDGMKIGPQLVSPVMKGSHSIIIAHTYQMRSI
jgi:hypothetical protein